LSYIKNPSTFCYKGKFFSLFSITFYSLYKKKEFYGENNIESCLNAASTGTFNNNQNINSIDHHNKQHDLNLSVYSQHSSVISTIKSGGGGDSNRQMVENKEQTANEIVEEKNNCKDLQV
jgi:hypothetical protein